MLFVPPPPPLPFAVREVRVFFLLFPPSFSVTVNKTGKWGLESKWIEFLRPPRSSSLFRVFTIRPPLRGPCPLFETISKSIWWLWPEGAFVLSLSLPNSRA